MQTNKLKAISLKNQKTRSALSVAAVFSVLLVLLAFFVPQFYSVTNFSNILEQCSTIGILAVGISFVLVGGGIDISLASNLCCSAVLGGLVMKNVGSIPLGIVVIFGTALAFGAFNGIAVAYFKMVPFIVTLSTQVLATGLGVLLSSSKSIFGIPEGFLNALTISIAGFPLAIYVLFVMVILYWLILNRSVLGRKIFSVGSNENAAVVSGINVRLIRMSTYLFSSLCSAIVAVLLTARLGCASMQMASDSTNMDVMCSAILGGVSLSGGKGSVWGAFLGACFIVVFSNLVNLIGIGYYPSLMIKGAVVVLVTCWDANRSKR